MHPSVVYLGALGTNYLKSFLHTLSRYQTATAPYKMRTKSEILMEHLGVRTPEDLFLLYNEKRRHNRAAEESTVMKFPYEAAEHPPLPSDDEIRRRKKACLISGPPATAWVY
jgi:hypothetical protein